MELAFGLEEIEDEDYPLSRDACDNWRKETRIKWNVDGLTFVLEKNRSIGNSRKRKLVPRASSRYGSTINSLPDFPPISWLN